ncbi:sugar phosphate isomerase/epimerase [Paenibacillus sp. N4]|uniref:sugar phosphate isomerase/epimerase family protein n=1 Tax=Paenibacillus vietnamensis TaxID=2590547 RepID=UPI001CD0A0CC|nr:sugar phosphate isomerase/epimerase family protein [Paenibacillus vietnamensis]MCA0753467.1 sugar phosphate isomerase/epimerase [Paenibacillus vietnamensis]
MSTFILSAFADEIDSDLKTQMDVLEQHGIKYIEMRGVNGKQLVSYNLGEVKEIKRQISARGFQLSAVGSPIGKIKITDEFEPHFELFKHTVEAAKIMECKYIRMFSFYIPKGEDPSIYRADVIDRWTKFAKVAEDNNVILLHENEAGIYGDTAERCLDLLTSLHSDHVRGIFDFANFVQCGETNYPAAYELLKNYIEYVHVKDAVRADGHVVPAGEGDGNVKEILQELNQRGYEGFLSLEPHLGHYTDFSALEPDSPGYTLPPGGAKRFAVAVQAIKNLLKEFER